MGPQIELLKNHGQFGADALHLLAICGLTVTGTRITHFNELALNENLAGRWRLQQIDTSQKSAFPGATAAQNGDDVLLMRLQRDAF